MKRKAQSEVVTTFALILIVLAAIGIVWFIVNKFMPGPNPFSCNEISLRINEARSSDSSLEIQRRAGGEGIVKSVKIIVNGSAATIQSVGDINCLDDDITGDDYPNNCVTPDANGRTPLSLDQIETKTFGVRTSSGEWLKPEEEVSVAAVIDKNGKEEVCNIIDSRKVN